MSHRPTPSRRPTRLVPSAALAAVLCLGVAACSGDEDSEDAEKPSGPAGSSATQAVASTVGWGAVAGKVAPSRRENVKTAVAGVVDGWLDAAYVGGEWPRTDFSGAFSGFTDGARARAEQDLELMSNSAVGGQIESVEVLTRDMKLDALGVKGRATAVTARFRLKFRTAGEVEGTEKVSGRLFLVPKDGEWRVFGYDVARSDRLGAA